MPSREEIEAWDMPIAPRLEACPACNFELDPNRPTFTCPMCGQDLTKEEEHAVHQHHS